MNDFADRIQKHSQCTRKIKARSEDTGEATQYTGESGAVPGGILCKNGRWNWLNGRRFDRQLSQKSLSVECMMQDGFEFARCETVTDMEVCTDVIITACSNRDENRPGCNLASSCKESLQCASGPAAAAQDHVDINQAQGPEGVLIAMSFEYRKTGE